MDAIKAMRRSRCACQYIQKSPEILPIKRITRIISITRKIQNKVLWFIVLKNRGLLKVAHPSVVFSFHKSPESLFLFRREILDKMVVLILAAITILGF